MENSRGKRRLLAIVAIGVLGAAVAVGVRTFHRKPIHGTWLGYSYLMMDGKLIADKDFGQYSVHLNRNGTYEENGNSTSGSWSQRADVITLKPTKFYEMTPDEHRKRFRKKNGDVSVTIERLILLRMKPMTMTYQHIADRLIFREHSMYYEYERAP